MKYSLFFVRLSPLSLKLREISHHRITTQSDALAAFTELDVVEMTIPLDENGKRSKCLMYDLPHLSQASRIWWLPYMMSKKFRIL